MADVEKCLVVSTGLCCSPLDTERVQHSCGPASAAAPNAARLQVFALAYNLASFVRQLTLPKPVRHWSLTTLREKLVKIGAKGVSHAKSVIFLSVEVAVPRKLFAAILTRVGRLRLACDTG